MEEDKEFQNALFRFSLIAPLLHLDDEEQLKSIMKATASKELDFPYSNKKRICLKTLKNYFMRYKQNGFDGLRRTIRSDKGAVKAASDDLVQSILSMKKEEPRRSARQIIGLIRSRPEYQDVSLAERTISRILKNNGLTRNMA